VAISTGVTARGYADTAWVQGKQRLRYKVLGSHTYDHAGTFTMQVSITAPSGAVTAAGKVFIDRQISLRPK